MRLYLISTKSFDDKMLILTCKNVIRVPSDNFNKQRNLNTLYFHLSVLVPSILYNSGLSYLATSFKYNSYQLDNPLQLPTDQTQNADQQS